MKLKNFIVLFLLAGTMIAPTCVSATMETTTNDQSLKVLSWNIYMLPRKAVRTGQSERAEVIARQLKDTDYDVIVFQEAFDKTARNLLWERLQATFPYQEGPVNLKGSPFRTNGGVWIISKYPMNKLGEIKYHVSSGSDMFARKGAMIVQLTKNGKTYQVVGTHLQSDDSERKSQIRSIQYNQMIAELMQPNRIDSIPQILCGDFNISKKDYRNYNRLVRSIEPTENPNCDKDICQNVPVIGVEQYTWDYTKNDLIPAPCEVTTYDYIFVRKDRIGFREVNRRVRVFAGSWIRKGKMKKSLSDHFAMEIEVVPVPPKI